ncbi:hypothetical protein BWQ92_15265 [Arthrobacter sp. QXT-31]|nr:hypothetical protein BWQ92_15265 [Arthrobacter sp. QXT-31]
MGAGIWLGIKAVTIRGELSAAQGLVPQLQDNILANDTAAASATLAELKKHTSEARQIASDPLWAMSQTVPWLGPNIQAVSAVALSADEIANLGAGPLVSAFQSLDWDRLAPNSKGVDLQPLTAAQPKISAAARAIRLSSGRLNNLDTESMLPEVSVPLIKAREQLNSLRIGIDAAADAISIAPSMMGHTKARNYLLLIQNNAEIRSTGGIPGALAVLRFDKGKLTLGDQMSATELGVMSPTIPVEFEQATIYSNRVGKFMQDVNLTPDFPTSASTAVAMWEQKTGKRMDGVISIDPVALSYLLQGTGAVVLDAQLQQLATNSALPSQLTSGNVVKTLLSDVYAKIPQPAFQDLYFAGVAKKIFNALSADANDSQRLLKGISKGAGEGRILLWSADPDEQTVISRYRVSGSISGPSISPSQFSVYFNDGTGAKMDYHVKRTVQLIEECRANGYSQVRVRVTNTNTAPRNAGNSLPAYVTGAGAFGVPAGSVQTNIVAYGPVQSNVEEAFVAGQKSNFSSQRHAGRPVGTVTVRLAPGQSQTVDFTFGRIVQHADPEIVVTPMVQSLKDVVLETKSATCGPPAETTD